jgi:hypothetical protein
MNVIDNILTEWAYRCPDGIVDLNNPDKVKILFEILKPILKEDIDDDILSMLTNIDDVETKEKVLKYLQTVNKKEDKEELSQIKSEISPKSFKIIHDKIEPYLLNKGLPEDKILTLIAKFAKEDEEEDLIKYYQKNHKFDVNTDLSILDIPKNELNPNTVNSIYGLMRGASGTKGVGKEEYFLVAFYNNVEKRKEGDLTIDGVDYEVKGAGSFVSDLGRGSFSSDVKPYLENFIKNLVEESKSKNIFNKENTVLEKNLLSILDKGKTEWPDKIELMYNEYVKIIKSTNKQASNNDINQLFISNLQKELTKLYRSIDLNAIVKENSFFINTFKKTIAKTLIDNTKKEEKYLFVSPEGKIKVIQDNEGLKNAIDNNEIKISALSDAVPRLTFQ